MQMKKKKITLIQQEFESFTTKILKPNKNFKLHEQLRLFFLDILYYIRILYVKHKKLSTLET